MFVAINPMAINGPRAIDLFSIFSDLSSVEPRTTLANEEIAKPKSRFKKTKKKVNGSQ